MGFLKKLTYLFGVKPDVLGGEIITTSPSVSKVDTMDVPVDFLCSKGDTVEVHVVSVNDEGEDVVVSKAIDRTYWDGLPEDAQKTLREQGFYPKAELD